MERDIVERLRMASRATDSSVCAEAADEIEKLRAELEAIKIKYDQLISGAFV